jgi:RHS repeat-associated protein
LSGANKFAYTVRDQLSSITPHGEAAKAIVSHGTGQADLAAIGSEEVIQNVLGVGITGSGESAKYYTRGSEGALLAKRSAKGKPSESEYFLQDPFGSVAILTNSSGSHTAPATGSYQYDPYGASLGAAPSTFGYESGQTLPAGLTHFGARYYMPGLAQWTQMDPMNQGQSLTQGAAFGYAGGDPVNNADPTGEGIGEVFCVHLGPVTLGCGGPPRVKVGLGAAKEISIHGPGGLQDALKKCGEGAIAGSVANSAQKVAESGATFKQALNLRSAFYAAGIGCVAGEVTAHVG